MPGEPTPAARARGRRPTARFQRLPAFDPPCCLDCDHSDHLLRFLAASLLGPATLRIGPMLSELRKGHYALIGFLVTHIAHASPTNTPRDDSRCFPGGLVDVDIGPQPPPIHYIYACRSIFGWQPDSGSLPSKMVRSFHLLSFRHTGSELGADSFDDDLGFRELPRLLFGVNLSVVHADLENTAGTGHKGKGLDVGFELIKQSRRQTDGLCFVVSTAAVFDFDANGHNASLVVAVTGTAATGGKPRRDGKSRPRRSTPPHRSPAWRCRQRNRAARHPAVRRRTRRSSVPAARP